MNRRTPSTTRTVTLVPHATLVRSIAVTPPKLWNAWKDRLLADLYTATRMALRRGLENAPDAEERIAETRDHARARLLDAGLDEDEISALFARMPETSFLRGRSDSVAWQAPVLQIGRAHV